MPSCRATNAGCALGPGKRGRSRLHLINDSSGNQGQRAGTTLPASQEPRESDERVKKAASTSDPRGGRRPDNSKWSAFAGGPTEMEWRSSIRNNITLLLPIGHGFASMLAENRRTASCQFPSMRHCLRSSGRIVHILLMLLITAFTVHSAEAAVVPVASAYRFGASVSLGGAAEAGAGTIIN